MGRGATLDVIRAFCGTLWCPSVTVADSFEEHREEVEQKVPGLATYLDEEHDHMFCCKEVASVNIATMVKDMLDE
eukprot:880613-Prorocentrum_minimum.AAC.2